MFARSTLRDDALAGLTVACIAIPLSLAIALASDVPPEAGLFTAIVAGIVCAFFGGTPLAVSGPAAAMAILVASVVQSYGMGGLLFVGLVCGALQLATGVFGLGRLIRLVPVPVVEGFTAGIGAIILIGQLPRVLGLPPPAESHVLDVLTHIRELVHEANVDGVMLAGATVAIVLALPRIHPRVPAALLGVVIPTLVVILTGIDVERIGALPHSLPLPSFPAVPQGFDVSSLLATSLVVYALASLESLLSSSAVDKMAAGTKRHDPDQELIGQGLGNVASALVGGIPVTGVIARSALNIQAGARTRLAAVVHSGAVLAAVLVFSSFMGMIPIAALAGVLVAVALRMLDPSKLLALFRASRADAAVYAVTFAVIVGVDLIAGIRWGIAAALLIAAVRLGQTQLSVLGADGPSPLQIRLAGPVTFLSSLRLESLHRDLERLGPGDRAVVDLSNVTTIDSSGAELIIDVVGSLKSREVDVAVLVTNPRIERRLLGTDHGGVLALCLARTEQDVPAILGAHAGMSPRQRLEFGVEHYRRHHLPRYADLFEKLAPRQVPHTLFITCSDSRIQPSLLTSTDPGELFILRNVGNMVPRWEGGGATSPAVGVEYAVGVLGVAEIVVCAHSRCGAIHAITHPGEVPARLTSVRSWVESAETLDLRERLRAANSEDGAARLNVLLQVDHLRGFPIVREKLEANALSLRAWFFDVVRGGVEEWDPHAERWFAVGHAADFPSGPRGPSPWSPVQH